MFEAIGIIITIELGVVIYLLLNQKNLLNGFYERVNNYFTYDKKLSREDLEIVMDKYHNKKK